MSFTPNNAVYEVNNIRNLATKIQGAQGAAWGKIIRIPEWLISLAEKFPQRGGANKNKADALFSWLSEAQLQSVHGGYVIHLKSKTWAQMVEQFMLRWVSLEEIEYAMGGAVSFKA